MKPGIFIYGLGMLTAHAHEQRLSTDKLSALWPVVAVLCDIVILLNVCPY